MMPKRLAFLGAALLLTACANDLVIEHEYQEAKSEPRLPMQKDGNQRPYQDLYPVPEAKDFYADQVLYRLPLPTPALTQQREKITFNRLAGDSWLTVQVTPSQLWPQLKHFISKQPELRSGVDNGRAGLMSVYQGDAHYQFIISQGFQPKSSELAIRLLSAGQNSSAYDEPASENARTKNNNEEGFAKHDLDNSVQELAEEKNQPDSDEKLSSKTDQMLRQVASFLLESVDQPAYSYAAQGISTAKKMWLTSDDKGVKQLYLVVSKERAMGSLRLGFASANFKVLNSNIQQGTVEVRYMPPLPEDEQPGFFKRMFGVKRKAFDKDVEYAGNIYQFTIKTLAPGKQQVSINKEAAQWPSLRLRASELNAMMRLLEHSIQ